MSKKSNMFEYAPALGLIFGCATGIITAVLINGNVGVAALIGAALGVVLGAVIYSLNYKKGKTN